MQMSRTHLVCSKNGIVLYRCTDSDSTLLCLAPKILKLWDFVLTPHSFVIFSQVKSVNSFEDWANFNLRCYWQVNVVGNCDKQSISVGAAELRTRIRIANDFFTQCSNSFMMPTLFIIVSFSSLKFQNLIIVSQTT